MSFSDSSSFLVSITQRSSDWIAAVVASTTTITATTTVEKILLVEVYVQFYCLN